MPFGVFGNFRCRVEPVTFVVSAAHTLPVEYGTLSRRRCCLSTSYPSTRLYSVILLSCVCWRVAVVMRRSYNVVCRTIDRLRRTTHQMTQNVANQFRMRSVLSLCRRRQQSRTAISDMNCVSAYTLAPSRTHNRTIRARSVSSLFNIELGLPYETRTIYSDLQTTSRHNVRGVVCVSCLLRIRLCAQPTARIQPPTITFTDSAMRSTRILLSNYTQYTAIATELIRSANWRMELFQVLSLGLSPVVLIVLYRLYCSNILYLHSLVS